MGLRPRGTGLFLLALLTVVTGTAGTARAQFGVNLFGASYHFDTEPEDGIHNVNPGLGLHWTFDRGRRTALEFSTGIFRDSYANANRHWALGARFRLAGPIELGAQLVRSESASLLDDMPHMGLLPLCTVRGRRLAVSAIYMPEVGGLNRVRTLGFVATIYPFGGGWDWDRRGDLAAQGWRALEFRIGRGFGVEAPPGIGVAWRRMFTAKHGLRLGVDLHGLFLSGSLPDEDILYKRSYDESTTEYGTALSIQYLRVHPRTGRVAPYWAVGLKTEFEAYSLDHYHDDTVTESVVAGVGVEYDLGGRWRLLAEYEGALAFMSNREFYGVYVDWDRSTLLEHGVYLGVVAGIGDDDAREGEER